MLEAREEAANGMIKRSKWGSWMVYSALLLLVGLVLLYWLAPTNAKGDPLVNGLLFYPTPYNPLTWTRPEFLYEDVTLTASDGVKINAWYLPAKKPKAFVLCSHGNAGNLSDWGDMAEEMRSRFGVSVLIYDYRGYGKSEGKPTVPGILKDGRAARDWLCKRESIKPDELVYCGRSLGGAVAVDLAAETGAKGLILESTFTSIPDMAKRTVPFVPRSIIRNRLDSLASIKNYNGPLLHCHGEADSVIPFEQGVELFKACPSERKTFVRMEGHDHNDPLPEYYREQQRRFFDLVAPTDREAADWNGEAMEPTHH
ncbi:MAG: alpha/beta hydrolase [Polyangiaceae bacterium]|nr:alpha/beta hydrolase [Polyangiaceae bacterium]